MTTPPLLLSLDPGKTSASPRKVEVLELGTCTLSTKASSPKLLGTLLTTKTLFLFLSSRPNTTTIPLYVQLTPPVLGPFSGPLFWWLKKISGPTLSTKYMQGTVPFGPLHGVLFGARCMTISFCLSLTFPLPATVSHLWMPNPRSRDVDLCPVSLIIRLFRRSLVFSPFTVINMTF